MFDDLLKILEEHGMEKAEALELMHDLSKKHESDWAEFIQDECRKKDICPSCFCYSMKTVSKGHYPLGGSTYCEYMEDGRACMNCGFRTDD